MKNRKFYGTLPGLHDIIYVDNPQTTVAISKYVESMLVKIRINGEINDVLINFSGPGIDWNNTFEDDPEIVLIPVQHTNDNMNAEIIRRYNAGENANDLAKEFKKTKTEIIVLTHKRK